MMDDIWKVYGYIHEYRRHEAVGRRRAGLPTKWRVRPPMSSRMSILVLPSSPEIVQWMRRIPMSAPFVSFPAAVLRASTT